MKGCCGIIDQHLSGTDVLQATAFSHFIPYGWEGLSLNDLIRKSVRRQETEPLNQRWADAARLTEALSGTTAV